MLLPVHARERSDTIVRAGCHDKSPLTSTTRARSAVSHAGLGQVAYRRGDPGLAIERFESALELRGSREEELPDVAESLGRAYVMVGELDRSIAVFERALASAEQLEDEVYEELGDPHRARELHELAAERPGPGSPTRRLARVHAGKAEAEAAYEHMEKAVGRQQNPAARPAQ